MDSLLIKDMHKGVIFSLYRVSKKEFNPNAISYFSKSFQTIEEFHIPAFL